MRAWATRRRRASPDALDPTPAATDGWKPPSTARVTRLIQADPSELTGPGPRVPRPAAGRGARPGGGPRSRPWLRRPGPEEGNGNAGRVARRRGRDAARGLRRGPREGSRGRPGRARDAVVDGSGRGPDQPAEDDQAHHVRPRRVRPAPQPGAPRGLTRHRHHAICGRTVNILKIVDRNRPGKLGSAYGIGREKDRGEARERGRADRNSRTAVAYFRTSSTPRTSAPTRTPSSASATR